MIEKKCPRCGAMFVCEPENPTQCQCAGILLTNEQRQRLHMQYADCLCCRCLLEVSER